MMSSWDDNWHVHHQIVRSQSSPFTLDQTVKPTSAYQLRRNSRPLYVSLQIEAAKNSLTCLWPPISSKHPGCANSERKLPIFLWVGSLFLLMEANFWNFSELLYVRIIHLMIGNAWKEMRNPCFFYHIESAKSYHVDAVEHLFSAYIFNFPASQGQRAQRCIIP